MVAIEEKVVSMKWDANQFHAGISQSLTALDKLNAKLKLQQGVTGLNNIAGAAQKTSTPLNAMAESVSHIADRFKTMGIVGVTAIQNVANQALYKGQEIAKSLSVAPIMDGFREYETNMNSIQTILANTQAAGVKLNDVTDVLDDLNHYSDQTIYNFSQMAKNIGTFTAAGVALKPAASAIKGIANLAALSGSNSEQASSAMYQLSQAISAGRVSLEDWNSVVNAGMGGTVFQRALAQNAEKLGTLNKGAVTLKGAMKNVTIEGKSFRESITAKPGQESWLTSKVLTQTLAQFTGDLSKAQLAAMGFRGAAADAIIKQAQVAKNAATEVKTLSQLMSTIKESVGSGWSQSFKLIFGDFLEAKGLFTGISDRLGKMVADSAKARNKMLTDWRKAGGRDTLIDALSTAFDALLKVMKPIKDAWNEAFPPATGFTLAAMAANLRDFFKAITPGVATMDKLKRTFAGVFAILGIGWDILKQVVGTIVRLLGVATEGTGGFLNFTAKLGDFFVGLRQAIQDGKGVENFFKGLGDILAVPLKGLKLIGNALGTLFGGIDSSKATDAVGKLSKVLEPMGSLGEFIAKAWGTAMVAVAKVGLYFAKLETKIGPTIQRILGWFSEITEGLNFDDLISGINAGSIVAIAGALWKMVAGGGGGGLGGLMDNLNDAIEGLTGSLNAMQNTLRAATLVQIAIAVGILAIAMNTLSKIDKEGLARAGTAIAVLFGQLMGAMLIFEKFSGFKGFLKMPFVAASMILLGIAINVLASAMTKIAKLDWNELGKGLTGVTVLIGALVVAMQKMPTAKLVPAAAGIVVLSVAIKILASAVEDMSDLGWVEMAKGLTGVAAVLLGLGLFTRFAEFGASGGVKAGIGIIALATGVKILASALQDMGALSWGEIAKGLVTTAAGMRILVLALGSIPPNAMANAAAIAITAAALNLIVMALKSSSALSWEDYGKGMAVMAGSLIILARALNSMTTALPGAKALVVASVGINALVFALKNAAELDWNELAKGMLGIGGSLTILSIALESMAKAAPGAKALILTAAALAVIGGVLAFLGSLSWGTILTGLFTLAAVFAIIGIAAAVLAPIIPAIEALAAAILAIGIAVAAAGAGVALFGAGLALAGIGLAAIATAGVAAAGAIVAMLKIFLDAIPMIVEIINKLLIALLQLIIDAVPKIIEVFVVLFEGMLTAADRVGPKFIETAFKLMTKLITAIEANMPRITDAGLNILSALLRGIGNRIGELVDLGSTLIVRFLNGMSKNMSRITTAAVGVIVSFINGISRNLQRIIQAGVNLIINFVNGLATAIRQNQPRMNAAGRNLASAIIDGMVSGIANGVQIVKDAIARVANGALDVAKNILGIHSPSKEFAAIGKFVMLGFRQGLDSNKKQVDAAFTNLRKMIANFMASSSKDLAALQKKLDKLQKNPKKNSKEIKATKAEMAELNKERARSLNLLATMTLRYKDEQKQLGILANKYDVVTAKLKAAQQKYVDIVKERDAYKKSIIDDYSDAVNPSGTTTLADYVTALKKQVEDTKSFANTMAQLRKLGLNDETYKDLVAAGPEALPFAKELLNGGKKSIDELNKLNKDLDAVGGSFGQSAADAMYQAGVYAAAGLVKGLAAQQKAIEAQMDKIANGLVKAIKSKLGIKSPSRVFAEIGNYTVQGLAQGMVENSDVIVKSAESVADIAASSLRKSLANSNKMLGGNLSYQPVIKPVLDLTDIRKNAGKLSGMLPGDAKLSVKSSYSDAVGIAAEVRKRGGDGSDPDGSGAPMVAFTQNNYSPKAISAAETYRNTKNQLSSMKGALSTSVNK